jgi:hypothetical protein
MAPSNTFFEQIPIETVKRIATEFPEKKPIGSDGHNIEVPNEATSPGETWRQIAQKVVDEPDPGRVVELAVQLIARLDEERLCRRPPLTRDAGDRSQ